MKRSGTLALTALALTGFAANSLLCRAALRPRAIDAASFTLVRIGCGALVLALLVRARRDVGGGGRDGSWRAALALFGYAIAFSLAYLRLSAGVGALILFGCVQATMVGGGWRAGERPRPAQLAGLALACAGLVGLLAPGLDAAGAPDPLGAALMALAGIAWGVYSLLGRGGTRPLAATARNFRLALAPAALLGACALPWAHASARGLALAAASGGLASGIAYSLWYAALRALGATQAAAVQLAVPVLTAILGILFLGEPASVRLALAGSVLLAGVALAIRRGPSDARSRGQPSQTK